MRSLFFSSFVFALLAACSPSSVSPPAECEEIVEACHMVDPGTGPIHDCHEFAEAMGRTAAECSAMRASCIALCRAAADAGAGQDAAAQDAAAQDAHAHD